MTVLKIILNIIIVILFIIAIVFVALRTVGFMPYKVYSGSMEPVFPLNSIVFARQTKFQDLKKGDIIVFANSNGNTVTHRIMEIDTDKKQVITKGDNNEFIDILPVNSENIFGKVYFKIPFSEKVLNKIQK